MPEQPQNGDGRPSKEESASRLKQVLSRIEDEEGKPCGQASSGSIMTVDKKRLRTEDADETVGRKKKVIRMVQAATNPTILVSGSSSSNPLISGETVMLNEDGGQSDGFNGEPSIATSSPPIKRLRIIGEGKEPPPPEIPLAFTQKIGPNLSDLRIRDDDDEEPRTSSPITQLPSAANRHNTATLREGASRPISGPASEEVDPEPCWIKKMRPDLFDVIMPGVLPPATVHAASVKYGTSSRCLHNHFAGEPVGYNPVHYQKALALLEPIRDLAVCKLKSTTSRKPKSRSEAGIIRQIEMTNFMCHQKLVVDLSPNVNFIYGQNGSGKSAILAAIQTVLGAEARKTHRATSLKELVRHSAPSAKIRITLLNNSGGDDGDADAYEYETYGDTITIERTIAAIGHRGYNGYRIFDENMQEQSRSKKGLEDILDKLNIQVDNPVTILSQEDSKKFLMGKPQDKYSFFTKATELDRLESGHFDILEQIANLDQQSYRIRNFTLDADIALVQKSKKSYEEHLVVDKLVSKLIKYQEKHAWAVYRESSDLLAIEKSTVSKLRQKVAKIRAEITEAQDESKSIDEVGLAKRDTLDKLCEEATIQSTTKHDLEVKFKQAREPQKALERQLKLLPKSRDLARARFVKANKALQQKRSEIVEKQNQSGKSEIATLTQQLQEIEEQLVTLNEKKNALKQGLTDSIKEYEDMNPYVRQAKEKCTAAQNRLDSLNERLQRLRSSTGNCVALFGPRCSKVKQLVNESVEKSRFKGPVVGPIGAFIHVVPGKEEFASLAQHAIGNWTLDRWIVTNDHDRKMVQSIRKHVGCQGDCGIFQISQQAKHKNVPPPPAEGIETVASILQCSNGLVFNCLIDNNKIEKKALSKSKYESESLLLKQATGSQYSIREKPLITHVFFLPHGDSCSIRNGTISLKSNQKPLRGTIGVDKSVAIAQAERDVVDAAEEFRKLQEESNEMSQKYRETKNKLDKSRRDLQQNKKEINQSIVSIDKLKNEIASLDIASSNGEVDTAEYEEEVQEAYEEVQKLADQDKQLREKIDELNPEINEIKASLTEIRSRNQKIMNDITKAEKELAKHAHHVSRREERIWRKRDKLNPLHDGIEKQENKVKDIQSNVDHNLDKARRQSFYKIQRDKQKEHEKDGGEQDPDDSRYNRDPSKEELIGIDVVDTSDKPSFFEAKIRRLKTMIKEEKKRRGVNCNEDRSIAYATFCRAVRQAEDTKSRCERVESLSKMLNEEERKRRHRWKQLRSHISSLTATKFDEILNKKGSCGDIEFDHTERTLDLVVQKNSCDATSQQRDVKALSGGERSFATIALLLALGESLETPFRILDEFDVFLDPIARKLTIESLITMAKRMEHRQFIFITPQDVSFLEPDPMLKVLKMTPPTRNKVCKGATLSIPVRF